MVESDSLVEHGESVYGKKVIFFKSSDSLADIFYQNGILKKESIAETLELDSEEFILSSAIKIEALTELSKGAFLIVDDVDKLTGKKLEVTKSLLKVCYGFCVSARSENAINATLRDIMGKNKREILTIELGSATATQDFSNYLFVFFVVFVFISGWGELALLLVAGRLLLRGAR